MAEPSKWRRAWRIAVGATVTIGVAASIVAVEAGVDEPVAAPAPTTRPAPERPAPTLAPVALASAPVWDSVADFGAPGVDGAAVRDGVALAYGPEHLALLDVVTGEVRWSVDDGDELDRGDGDTSWSPTVLSQPKLVATEDGLAVPVEYSLDGELGLAVLSAEDGDVVWQTPAEQTDEQRWVVDDRLAVVGVDGELVAYDLGSGDVLWEQDGAAPVAIAGDVVVTEAAAGLDLTTGEPRWDRTGSEVVLAAGDVVLLRGADGGVLVDAAGAPVADLDETAGCTTDGVSMIACPGDRELWTFDLVTREAAREPVDVRFTGLAGVLAGRVVGLDGDTHFGIDRVGNLIDETLPGAVVAATAQQVLFRTGRVLSIHPLVG